jgi:hypothetical protein
MPEQSNRFKIKVHSLISYCEHTRQNRKHKTYKLICKQIASQIAIEVIILFVGFIEKQQKKKFTLQKILL